MRFHLHRAGHLRRRDWHGLRTIHWGRNGPFDNRCEGSILRLSHRGPELMRRTDLLRGGLLSVFRFRWFLREIIHHEYLYFGREM